MSKDSPHPTPANTPDKLQGKEIPTLQETFEDDHEGHQHHAGCRHSKQHFPVTQAVKIGRNDPCICGSGKKYKKCCLS